MRFVGRVACMEQMRNAYRILVASLKGRDHLGDLGLYGSTVGLLTCIL
jgi:hypothetical protein